MLLLIGITALLPWLVETVVARFGAGPVPWQLAIRRLQLSSGTAARTVNGIAVAVAGAIALQMLFAGVEGQSTEKTNQDPNRAQLTMNMKVDNGTQARDAFDPARRDQGRAQRARDHPGLRLRPAQQGEGPGRDPDRLPHRRRLPRAARAGPPARAAGTAMSSSSHHATRRTTGHPRQRLREARRAGQSGLRRRRHAHGRQAEAVDGPPLGQDGGAQGGPERRSALRRLRHPRRLRRLGAGRPAGGGDARAGPEGAGRRRVRTQRQRDDRPDAGRDAAQQRRRSRPSSRRSAPSCSSAPPRRCCSSGRA